LTSILIIKTGALGDVLRTTAILPGLHERYEDCRVTWVTHSGAVDLVVRHPLVAEVIPLDPGSVHEVEAVQKRLSVVRWDRILSFDDEEALCRLATSLSTRRLSGAYLDDQRTRTYTPDVAPWFDMGLLSRFGKEEADRRKLSNTKSHPAIFAEMLGVPFGKTMLPLPDSALRFAQGLAQRRAVLDRGPIIGLNTGAGGRWHSKCLPVDRTVQLAHALHEELAGQVVFLLLGGPPELDRNQAILREIGETTYTIDTGCDNSLTDFAALIGLCNLLVTSDSLALHVGVALGVRIVGFFAPTSAAEIELYGLGEKIQSTAPDYCSYRPDASTATITVERLKAAVLRQLSLVDPVTP
jgi:heptosyltransferase-2